MRNLVYALLSFLRAETANIRRYEMPWRRRLWLYWHGFLSSRDAVWNLSRAATDDSLSDAERFYEHHGVRSSSGFPLS